MSKPKVLIIDIETAPLKAFVWNLYENNVSLNQISSDWYVLAFAAKWLDAKKVIYFDQSAKKPINNDKELVRKAWQLLDEADIVITQNGKSFDTKKLNARFIAHGFKPPSSYRQIDTKLLAKKHFGFTSSKLEYMTGLLNKKYRKLKHNEFPGQDLWTECLKGNKKAWRVMRKYNIFDVLSTEELYKKLLPWDNNVTVNFGVYYENKRNICGCGNKAFSKYGFAYSNSAKFQRYRCTACGAGLRSGTNEFSKKKKEALKKGILR